LFQSWDASSSQEKNDSSDNEIPLVKERFKSKTTDCDKDRSIIDCDKEKSTRTTDNRSITGDDHEQKLKEMGR